MNNPVIGFAASARDWSDRLHRFLLDHGGGTVRGRFMSSDQAISGSFDVLFIDDVCSFLNSRLVVDLRAGGKSIVGVFDSKDGSDAKRRLLEAGISDVIESDATPEEFLSMALSTLAHLPPSPGPVSGIDRKGFCIGLTGPPGGVGVTEIACALANDLGRRHPTALVDFNLTWPGVGQRLGLPVHPNLRTAIDFVLHEPERLASATHILGGLSVVSGLANIGSGLVSSSDLVGLVSGLSRFHSHVVLDLGHLPETPVQLIHHMDAVLVVGVGNPVGLTRLIGAFERVEESAAPDCEVGLVVNRVDNEARQRDEIVGLLNESAAGVPVVMIPEDRRLRRSSWDGSPINAGAFIRTIQRLAGLFDGVADDR